MHCCLATRSAQKDLCGHSQREVQWQRVGGKGSGAAGEGGKSSRRGGVKGEGERRMKRAHRRRKRGQSKLGAFFPLQLVQQSSNTCRWSHPKSDLESPPPAPQIMSANSTEWEGQTEVGRTGKRAQRPTSSGNQPHPWGASCCQQHQLFFFFEQHSMQSHKNRVFGLFVWVCTLIYSFLPTFLFSSFPFTRSLSSHIKRTNLYKENTRIIESMILTGFIFVMSH